MKENPRIVVVNDCAHVMEDIIPYLTDDFNITFIQRSRGLWSKTFGLLWKILRARGNCVFHVSYSLQDAFLVDKFKHLDILHVHGSDVRWTLHSKKWGWIVKHNLKHAKKIVYATPDLEQTVKKFNPDSSYLATPVKTETFTLKKHYSNEPKAVYFKLAYEELPAELMMTLRKNNVSLTVLERNVPYVEMSETLQSFDVFVDRFSIPSFSKTCLEAMACGLTTIDYRHNPVDRVPELLRLDLKREGEENRQFVTENHNVEKIADRLSGVWKTFES